jgi:hypothetical protein
MASRTAPLVSLRGSPGLSVWVAASGSDAANLVGAVVRIFGRCGAVRAQIGSDVVLTSAQQHVATVRGWGVGSWDVEIVGGSAGNVERMRLTAVAFGGES